VKKRCLTLLAVGDVAIDHEDPESTFYHVAEVLRSADICYANCEQPLSDKGTPNPKQAIYSNPETIRALLYAGIDIVSLANNHAQDWGKEAFLDTMERLERAGIHYVGAGKNLAEARRPVILERNECRIGFLAYCSVGPEGFDYEAQDDRPGYAPLRAWTIYEHVDPQPGTWPRIVTIPYREDLERMVDDVRTLRKKVDVVVVCPHWGLHVKPRVIPMYCFDIAHVAIDAGADLIIGTHPHVLKGIEVYRGRVIFYSTGDFAMRFGPHMRDHKHISFLDRLYEVSEKEKQERRYSLIVKTLIEDGGIKRVSYIPCYITDGVPEVVGADDPRAQRIFEYVLEISEGLHSRFSWDGGEVVIHPDWGA